MNFLCRKKILNTQRLKIKPKPKLKSKMKKFFALLTPLFVSGALYAQDVKENEKSMFETLTKIEKKTDKFNLLLNMHAGFDANFTDGSFDKGAFKFKQLRLEMKGNVNDWLSYRYRQRLNRGNNGSGMIDNLPTSIDIASVGFKLSPKFSIVGGKQCAAYGGFEFDLNPIEIYQYSDMIDYMDNFLTGVNFVMDFTPAQQLAFQVLDARNGSFKDTYGPLPSTIEDTKLPLVYTLNWNGSFADNMFQTRWSASVMQQAKDRNMYYFAFGQQLNIKRSSTYFDVMYARQQLDRKGIMTKIINKDLDGREDDRAMDASYLSLVLHSNYRVTDKWNIFAKGMYETQGLAKANTNRESGRYRTSIGYSAGVEFYPMNNSNLHFFLAYTGRAYSFTQRAKDLGWKNSNTSELSTGFIYQLPVF